MKIYLDDVRPAPEGWELARTVDDALIMISLISLEEDYEISLDFDMGMTTPHCQTCDGKGFGRMHDFDHPDYCPDCTHEISSFDQEADTGVDLLYHIIEEHKKNPDMRWLPNKIYIHSANPVGRSSMRWVIMDMQDMFGVQYPEAFR